MFRRLKALVRRPKPIPTIISKPKPTPQLSDWQGPSPNLCLRKGLHPHLKKALSSSNPLEAVEEIAPSIYRFPLFDDRTLQGFQHEIRSLLDWIAQNQVSTSPPNSMNEYGIILSEWNWEEDLKHIRKTVISPLASLLFPEVGGASLDAQHAFIVDYGFYRDTDLGFHVDNSEVTLNLCLGAEFSGSELYFQGRRCAEHRQTPHRASEHVVVPHQPGFAILHAGAHRHGTHPIRSGSRQNLIMWCSSSTYRKKEESCDEWCGAHDASFF